MAKSARNRLVTVRLTEEEMDLLQKLAGDDGVSEYVRSILFKVGERNTSAVQILENASAQVLEAKRMLDSTEKKLRLLTDDIVSNRV